MSKGVYVGVKNFESVSLPSGYTQVGYIESSGTQYIDTGFQPNQDTRLVLDFQLLSTSSADSSHPFIFGARKSSSANCFVMFLLNSSNKFGIYYGATTETQYFTTAISYSDRNTIDFNKNTVTSGSETLTFTAQTYSTPGSLYLFACNNNGSVFRLSSTRIYSCKIYDNGTLVRDLWPCKNSSGTLGLYDLVNSTFYTNVGTGSFIEGSSTAGGVARKVAKMFVGVASVARKVKKGYIGVNEYASQFFGGGTVRYFGTITPLSVAKRYIAGASVGNYAVFAGGQDTSNQTYSTITNAYNQSLTRSIPTALSVEAYQMYGTSIGNYAIFAGGFLMNGQFNSTVTTYNTSLTRSTASALSKNRYLITTGSVGNYALFAGGKYATNYGGSYNSVDAYNKSLTRSNPDDLMYGYYYLGSASVGNYVLFAGGQFQNTSGKTTYYKGVTAYDTSLTRSLPTELSELKTGAGGASIGDYALFAGGDTSTASSGATTTASKVVNAYDSSLTRTTIASLPQAQRLNNAQNIDNFALYIAGHNNGSYINAAYVYDTSLTRTTITGLSVRGRGYASAVVGNNALYAGGYIDGTGYIDTVEVYTTD